MKIYLEHNLNSSVRYQPQNLYGITSKFSCNNLFRFASKLLTFFFNYSKFFFNYSESLETVE